MSSRYSIEAVFSAVDKMSGPMTRMTGNVNKFSNNGQKAMSGFGGATLSAGNIVKGLVGFSLIDQGVQGIINFAQEGLKLASDLQEVQNVVDTTFGSGSKQIDSWAKSASAAFGISELQAKQFNGTLGAMMKSSGVSNDKLVEMSTTMSGLAGDFASFYNLDSQAAFDKIRSGISGETEPLKQLGINMSVANLEAFNLSKGITKQWQAMTQAEQVQTRYNYLMAVSKDAQGDFAKTLDTSAANQKRVMEMQKQQLAANIMSKLLPNQLAMYKQINSALDFLNAHHEGLATTVKIVAGVIGLLVAKMVLWKIVTYAIIAAQKTMTALGWLSYLWMMRDAIGAAVMRTQAWAVAQRIINFLLAANPIGLIIIAVGVLAYAIYDLYTNWNSYALQFNISIQNFITGFARARMEVYELLNAIGLISDKELTGAKLSYLENFTAGVKMRTQQLQQNNAPITQRDSMNQIIESKSSEQNLNIRNDSKNNVDLNGQNIPQGRRLKLQPSGG